MSKEENIRVLNDWIAAHRKRDIDKMLTFAADDITVHSSAGKDMPPARGKEEARVHWQAVYNIFPDMKMDIVAVTADEDRVVAEISHGGTMQGKIGDKEPTGKSYRVQAAFRFDFSNGKINSIRSYWDTGSMMMQLGLIPTPQK